jgi:hypothetical protein
MCIMLNYVYIKVEGSCGTQHTPLYIIRCSNVFILQICSALVGVCANFNAPRIG